MFQKIDISLFKESMTKYPNGKTIFEALAVTITSFNDYLEDINLKVNEGLIATETARSALQTSIAASFELLNTTYDFDFGEIQTQLIEGLLLKANADDVYSKIEIDAALDLKVNKAQGAWLALTLINGWATTVGEPAKYRKNAFGVVEFRGKLIPTAATNESFATINIDNGEYKPLSTTMCMIGSGGTAAAGKCYISGASGFCGVAGYLTTATYYDLGGFRYFTI